MTATVADSQATGLVPVQRPAPHLTLHTPAGRPVEPAKQAALVSGAEDRLFEALAGATGVC